MSDGCMRRAKSLVPFLAAKDVGKILQVGGGDSAAVFAENGFGVTVLDPSPEVIDTIRSDLERQGYSAQFVISSILESDLDKATFDFVFAYNTVYYQTGQAMAETIRKLLSLLRPDGLFYMTFISTRHADYGKGTEVEPTSFRWGGRLIHFSTAAQMVKLFKRAEIIDMRDQEQETQGSFHWHIMGRNRDLTPPGEES